MHTQDFTHSISVPQAPAEVFPVLLNVRAWWSGLYDESFEDSSEKPGDEFDFRAGGGAHYTRQLLVALEPDKKVEWLVTEAHLSFAAPADEWKGTRIRFELEPEGTGTRILFTHEGLVPAFACYGACAPGWTRYLQERLPQALRREAVGS